MRLFAIVATAWPLLCAGPAFAQVDDPTDPLSAMPSLGATSPLGIGPTGLPLGSTEITTPGVSPVPTGVTGTIAMPITGTITSSGTTCSAVGTLPTGMYGSTATYDGDCCVVDANLNLGHVNVTYRAGRLRANRNSVGCHGDQQSGS
jgi:hypothetical protein